MKKFSILFYLAALLAMPFVFGFQVKPEEESVTLQQAIAKGYVECRFENNKGYVHYSKCLVARIRNTSGKVLQITVENGTQVIPEDSVYQNLIVTQNMFVSLYPNEKKDVELNAMCTEPHDRAPGATPVSYRLGRSADGVMKAVVDMIDKKAYFNSEGQNAVWCVAKNSGLDDIAGYDTVAVSNLQHLIARLTGKKIPPPPAPDDYKRNYYAPAYQKKITLGGDFEFSFSKPKNILIGMFDANNVLVRELYKKDGEAPGVHKQSYEFDASVYTQKFYFIRLIADGQVKLESKVELN